MSDIVYRGMTADELNREYNNRARVPEHPAIIESWQKRSADLRAKSRVEIDLKYGPESKHGLDLFLPEGEGPFPIHAFIHGGYWQAMDKEDFSFVADGLVGQGVAVAILNYTLCPDTTVTGIVEEMREAATFLYRSSSEHQCDPNRLHVSGHSAGGHLVAMLLATDWNARSDDLPADLIKSGLSISGVFDLEALVPTAINTVPAMTNEEARSISPMFLKPVCAAPLSLVIGGDESAEFHRQSEDFAECWRTQLPMVEVRSERGLNHFTIVGALTDPNAPLFRTARDFALA